MSRHRPSERGSWDLLGAAFGVGFVAGPALGALAALGGAHVPFYVASAIAFVNGLVAIKRLPETRPVGHGEPKRPNSMASASPTLRRSTAPVWPSPRTCRVPEDDGEHRSPRHPAV